MPIHNKMPKCITKPNLRLLTQQLQEKAEGLDRNVPVFPETLKKAHQRMCGNKDRQTTVNKYVITANKKYAN